MDSPEQLASAKKILSAVENAAGVVSILVTGPDKVWEHITLKRKGRSVRPGVGDEVVKMHFSIWGLELDGGHGVDEVKCPGSGSQG